VLQLALPTLARRQRVLASLPLDLFTFGSVGTRWRSFVTGELVVVLIAVESVSVVSECLGAGTLASKDSGKVFAGSGRGSGVLARLGGSVERDERVGSDTLAGTSCATPPSGGFDGGGSVDGRRYIGCRMRRSREGVLHGLLRGGERDESVEVKRHVGRRQRWVLLGGQGKSRVCIPHSEHVHVIVVTVGEERARERRLGGIVKEWWREEVNEQFLRGGSSRL
jgi:hypothetical protein